jgi:membrane-associated phospholipid phosphatase
MTRLTAMFAPALSRSLRRRSVRLAIVCLAYFTLLGLAVRSLPLEAIEIRLLVGLQESGNRWTDSAMGFFSLLGKTRVLALVAVHVAAVLLLRRKALPAACTLATLVYWPLDLALKEVWDRSRPQHENLRPLVYLESHAFPSGHAMGSACVYGFLAYVAWTHLAPGRRRTLLVSFLCLLPVLVSLSRVYLAAHWPTDVLGGMVVGASLAVGLGRLYRRAEKSQKPPVVEAGG